MFNPLELRAAMSCMRAESPLSRLAGAGLRLEVACRGASRRGALLDDGGVTSDGPEGSDGPEDAALPGPFGPSIVAMPGVLLPLEFR
jgi:hypothetical protein